ncbi:MAG TPA: DNA-binding domain-containing protein [Sphingomicrobium sp.]
MTQQLIELQRLMRDAILTEGRGLENILAAGSADPVGRLGIYRNNTFASLTEALMTTFPATVNLLDARFFRYAADAFIRAHPPREPRLAAYGAAFPAFLSRFPASAGLAYVADVARLEWALRSAGQAAEAAPAAPGILSGKAPAWLLLQPSLRFIVSRWPIDALWEANRTRPAVETFALVRSPVRLQVRRRGDSVAIAPLTAAAFTFRRALAAGRPLETAANRALGRDHLFDLLAEVISLFRDGLVIDTRP